MVKTAFFYFFCFSIYKIVDGECNMDIYQSVTSIESIIRNPEFLKFIPHHIKTKSCVSMQLKKSPFLIRHVSDKYKTQQICDKAILKNCETLNSVPDCYKNQ